MGNNLPTTSDNPLSIEPYNPASISFKNFLRQNFLILLFGFLGLVFLMVGVISLFLDSQNKESGIIIEEGQGVVGGKIKVDIEGAVVRPGVYELTSQARAQEALILAGGLSSQADREWVAKNLNLAATLTDGAKIYIPQEGETQVIRNSELGISSEGTLRGKININSASEGELDKLPGVGPVTAQKIIAQRPYQTIEELVSKKVVGEGTFSKIKEQITVW